MRFHTGSTHTGQLHSQKQASNGMVSPEQSHGVEVRLLNSRGGSISYRYRSSTFDSQRLEDLWTYLESARKEGSDVVAINGNILCGNIFCTGLFLCIRS